MVEAFLESVLEGVESLGWASAKKVAEHTGWALDEVQESLNILENNGKIKKRKKGRGHQFGPLVEKEVVSPKKVETKIEIQDVPPEPPKPSDTLFPSLDTLLLEGSQVLPKGFPYTAEEFAKALLDAFPKSPWPAKDIMLGIGKLVRLQRLDLCPFMDGAMRKYQYIVK